MPFPESHNIIHTSMKSDTANQTNHKLVCTFIPKTTLKNQNSSLFNSSNHSKNSKGYRLTKDWIQKLNDSTLFTRFMHLISNSKNFLVFHVTPHHKTVFQSLAKLMKKYLWDPKRAENLFLSPQIEELAQSFPNLNNQKYFIRLNACSPKDSIFRGPVTNPSQAIKQIITSDRATLSFRNDSNWDIIFKPWREYPLGSEFRVFIYQKKITGVSQYHFLNNCGWNLKISKSPQLLHTLDKSIHALWDSLGQPFENTIMDIFYNEESHQSELIEFNPFGMEGPTGSCLFHWKTNQLQLYGGTEFIEYRFLL